MENVWDQKFAQKYCHLKETHFQGSEAGLLSALVESLRFVDLPPSVENDWNPKFTQKSQISKICSKKYCHLKESHFQGSGPRLWWKALDLLLSLRLPHTFFTILPLWGGVWKTNCQCLLKHTKKAESQHKQKGTHLLVKKGVDPTGKFSTVSSGGSDAWLPIYIFWFGSQLGTW